MTESRHETPPPTSSEGLAVESTPMSKKAAGPQVYTSTHVYRNTRIEDMVQEAQGHIVGPMPLDKFVNRFLSGNRNLSKAQQNTYYKYLLQMQSCTEEKHMYPIFIDALNIPCPNYPGLDTHSEPLKTFKGIEIKPDVCLVPKDHEKVNLATVEIMIEFKYQDGDDAFSTRDSAFQPDIAKLSRQSKDTLGQITAYASAHKSAQFRTHFFSFLIFKKHGRIMFWDSTGVLVTEKFLLNDPNFLKFLIYYNDATLERRGHDTTTSFLSGGEIRKYKDYFPQGAKLVKVAVNQDQYVVERSELMGAGSPFGRSTRPFDVAICMSSEPSPKVVFLKDTWRVVSRDREDDVYKLLKEKNIPCIPTVQAAYDVPGQVTQVQEIAQDAAPWGKDVPKTLRKLQHFRLVLKEVGTSLLSFESTKCLVTIICEALKAHKAAYELARTLHRDISVNNIMIGPDNHALLIDWDLSKHRDDTKQSASERTGTWQFTAARLLKRQDEQPIPNLADDLESFVHVLTWVALRHTTLATGADVVELGTEMQTMFDQSYEDSTGELKGGNVKSLALKGRDILRYLPRFALSRLLNDLFHLVSVRYEEDPKESTIKLPPDLQPGFELYYKKRLEQLNSSDYMIQLFESSLGENNWPSSDAAVENPIPVYEHRIIKKRAADIDEVDNTKDSSSSNKRSRET